MGDERVPRTAVVIEDDEIVRNLLVDLFESAGFTAYGAVSGSQGIDAVVAHDPLITTVDINMPGIDGLETTRRVRARSGTHIIVVSALTDEADAVLALSAGADDFVAKPFRAREFRARIDAVLRRVSGSAAEVQSAPSPVEPDDAPLVHGDLVADRATRTVEVGGVEAGLTRTEFDLLVALLESGRRVRTREELVRITREERGVDASDDVSDVEARSIEAHITKLRRKLGEDANSPRYIETVRGVGYRLTAAESAQ